MRTSGYSILAICSDRLTYDIDVPIQTNLDVIWMYKSLQKWMHDVYYATFNQYPRLYLHGQSRGAVFASLLCRVLPVQGQIWTISAGNRDAMTVRSKHNKAIQTRLSLDPEFANWFHFRYCYQNSLPDTCPGSNGTFYLSPVPPSYFIHAAQDTQYKLSDYTQLILEIQKDSLNLGGVLLANNNTLKIHVSQPLQITPTYMQHHFTRWYVKPYASKLFYEHMVRFDAEYQKYPNASGRVRRTFGCSPIDFTFFLKYPDVMKMWSKEKQDEYNNYTNDIRLFQRELEYEFCGDLLAFHDASSRHTSAALIWLKEMDNLRFTLLVSDFNQRPLRIWMYDKGSLISGTTYREHQSSNHTSCNENIAAHQIYAPEFFLQDYFRRLNNSRSISRHNLIWSDDPLLADYYFVPHDLFCLYYQHGNGNPGANLNQSALEEIYRRFNREYFEPILSNIRNKFPYWNMTRYTGSNHIIPFIFGKNMGILYEKTQQTLGSVIQLALTGIRQDMLPSNSPPLYLHRNVTTIYRHGYDILLPPFIRLQYDARHYDVKHWYEKKTRLLHFIGTVNHSNSLQSPRMGLLSLARDIMTEKNVKYKSTIMIEKKQLQTLLVIDGEVSDINYVETLRSSVFGLCPEGFSPWSARLYDTMFFEAIPVLFADGIVLPFERFIDWRLISHKINVSRLNEVIDLMSGDHRQFEQRVTEKMQNIREYSKAFKWPYSAVDRQHRQHTFLEQEDLDRNGTMKVFHFLSLELRCRRLEQLYGLTSTVLSTQSIEAREHVCENHQNVCACLNEKSPIAFDQY